MEAINFTRSNGDMNLEMRVLQTMTLHTHANGTIYVTDDRNNNQTKGAGFPNVDAAVKWFKRIDEARYKIW